MASTLMIWERTILRKIYGPKCEQGVWTILWQKSKSEDRNGWAHHQNGRYPCSRTMLNTNSESKVEMIRCRRGWHKISRYCRVYPGNATSNSFVLDLITRFIWTFTLRSYNYWLHKLASLTLRTPSLSGILAPGFCTALPGRRIFTSLVLTPILFW
jgi:hypothetical protein